MSEEVEWWIEVEISSTNIKQDLNDDILVKLHATEVLDP